MLRLLAFVTLGTVFCLFFSPIGALAYAGETASVSLPANVEYDDYGVPHITAYGLPELFYTFGYITAKDRLFQLDVTRRKASGRLAELVGRSELDEDILVRNLNLYASAEGDFVAIARELPEAVSIVNSYANGINAFIEENGLPPEYSIIPPFEPWRPLDSLAIARSISLMLAEDFRTELWKFRVSTSGDESAVGLSKSKDLLSSLPLFPIIQMPVDTVSPATFVGEGSPLGSNAFVISGKFTESGYPILANDPHLEITFPSIWYEVWLTLKGEFSVRGATVPGIPLIAVGANEYYAWGITALQGDNQDILLLDESSLPKSFLQEVLESREETFKVREGLKILDEKRTLKYMKGVGPVIDEQDGKLVILKWVNEVPSLEAVGFYRIAVGKSTADFGDAVSLMQTPYAFLFASHAGDVGFFVGGLMPLRTYDGSEAQIISNPSQLKNYDWEFHSPDDLPSLFNPPEGFIVSANNPPALDRKGFPIFAGNYAEGTRARRISELIKSHIKSGRRFSVSDAMLIQTDTYSLYAEALLPTFVKKLENPSGGLTDKEEIALSTLIAWNRRMDMEEPGALIWRLIETSLNETASSKYRAHYRTPDVVLLALRGEAWFTFTRDDLRKALRFSADNAFSDDDKLLSYGDKHKIHVVHPLPIYSLASPGDLPASGGLRTVDVSVGEYHGGVFYKDFGPSLRIIFHLADPLGGIVSIIPGGQSGLPSSPNFADQVPLYIEGEYKYSR